jgi:hypothetical protein
LGLPTLIVVLSLALVVLVAALALIVLLIAALSASWLPATSTGWRGRPRVTRLGKGAAPAQERQRQDQRCYVFHRFRSLSWFAGNCSSAQPAPSAIGAE